MSSKKLEYLKISLYSAQSSLLNDIVCWKTFVAALSLSPALDGRVYYYY